MTTAPDPAEITPPIDPATYARPRAGLGLAGWAILVLCLICVFGGVTLSRFIPASWLGRSEAAATPPVDGAPAPLTSAPVATPPLSGRAPLATPEAPAAGSAELAALQTRVQALEAGQTRTVNAAAAALAAASLAEVTQGSGSFEAELAALERVLPMSAEVRSLRPFAEAGAPSRAALAADFDNAAARASVAARAPGDRAGPWARITYALASIVTIRRVEATTGDDADALLARAGDAVAGGDVEGALQILRGLPPKSADAMASWRARAQQRVAVDRQVAAVRALALSDLMAVSRERS